MSHPSPCSAGHSADLIPVDHGDERSKELFIETRSHPLHAFHTCHLLPCRERSKVTAPSSCLCTATCVPAAPPVPHALCVCPKSGYGAQQNPSLLPPWHFFLLSLLISRESPITDLPEASPAFLHSFPGGNRGSIAFPHSNRNIPYGNRNSMREGRRECRVPEGPSSSEGRPPPRAAACARICFRWCLKTAVLSSSSSQPSTSAACVAHSKRMNCLRPTARGGTASNTQRQHVGWRWVVVPQQGFHPAHPGHPAQHHSPQHPLCSRSMESTAVLGVGVFSQCQQLSGAATPRALQASSHALLSHSFHCRGAQLYALLYRLLL